MYGRATNIAKKMAESENKNKIKEMVRKALMQEADIEVGADRYEGEKELGQVSIMMDELESALKAFDWYYYMSDDPRVYRSGSAADQNLSNLVKKLKDLGYGEDVKKLYNQYAPSGDIDMRMKEGKKEDVDGDGDIDSKDYLAKRDAAIQKAKDKVKEDIDLGHEDNEPHMVKADLYRIGKYAMELYAMAEELEETGQEIDFPAWWQAMITDAAVKMVKAKHYLDFELKEPAIDAFVDTVTGEKPHMGEPEPPMMEGEVTKIDKLAAKIAKALKNPENKETPDQNNIKQARKAMNNGDLEMAEKLLKPYLEEGFFDRIKAGVKGAAAGVGQAAKNIGAAVKGDPSQFKNVSNTANMAKLGQKVKTFEKEINDVINDINKLFPKEKLDKDPNFKATIDKYMSVLNQAKTLNSTIAKTPSQTSTSTSTNNNQEGPKYVGNTPPTKTRDEKGRFVSTKSSTNPTESKPISSSYEVTKDSYSYKGKDYPVQVDKKTKEKFFQHEDGRIMDIAAIEKTSQFKKKTTGVAEKLAKKLKETT
jgi:hypothetical protein